MNAIGFDYVSINAQDLEESVRFHTEIFRMEKIPINNFGFPVQYLRFGDLQLHIFEHGEEVLTSHYFGHDGDHRGQLSIM